MKIKEQLVSENTKAYFNRIAGDWSSHYSEAGLMRGRIQRFVGALEEFANPHANILDFGCGSGELTLAISKKGWHVKGCDISEEMLRRAEDVAGENCIDWYLLREQNDLKLPFHDATFDVIVASSVFEYLSKPEVYLREFHRILSKNGRILVSVPDLRHPLQAAEEARRRNFILKIFRRIWNLSRYGKDTDYLKYSITRYSPEDWSDLLRDCSFSPSSISVPSDPLLLLQAIKNYDA